MFATVSTYRARLGEDDAIIALHEDWQRKRQRTSGAYLSWMLLQNKKEPREFVAIACFPSEESVQAAMYDLNRDGWYTRLISLLETEPVLLQCTCIWRLIDGLSESTHHL